MPRQSELLSSLFANIREQKLLKAKDKGLQAKIDAVYGFMRAHQKAVEADLSSHVAILSARQQGKSTGALLLACLRCLQKAGAQWVIIGLTRGSIQRIYWDALRSLNDAFELGIKFQEQRLVVRFPSGSQIHFFGADKLDEVEKLRGSRFHGAIIDECKSFPHLTLKLLIEDILGACLKGQAGQLYLIGTPGDVLAGEFYLATSEPHLLEKQKRWSNLPYTEKTRPAVINGEQLDLRGVWSFHLWGPQTNDVIFENERTGEKFTMWEAFLKEKELRGWPDDHPTWRREYLGQWVPGDGRLVYRYRPHIHDYEEGSGPWGIPVDDAGWRTVLGLDFGTKDGTAMVVWAFHPHIPHLYEVYSEKRKPEDFGIADLRMPIRLIAQWYKELEREYGPFEAAVGDPAGLATMVIDTLATEHGVYVEAAEKNEKLDHIELLNDDLDAAPPRIHIRRGGELGEEMLGNKWLEKTLGTPKRKEDPATPNDLCDAALYAFRWCLHRQTRPKPPGQTPPATPEWFRQRARDEYEETLRRAIRAREPGESLDRDWWN